MAPGRHDTCRARVGNARVPYEGNPAEKCVDHQSSVPRYAETFFRFFFSNKLTLFASSSCMITDMHPFSFPMFEEINETKMKVLSVI